MCLAAVNPAEQEEVMKKKGSKVFLLLASLCLLLGGCGNASSGQDGKEPSVTAGETEKTAETETVTAGEISGETKKEPEKETAGETEETKKAVLETPKVPPAAPVGNLSELLFERDDVDEVLVVIGRNGLDDITIKTSEEEKNAILDLLYAADLSEWEDCEREGGANADFKIRSGETEVKLSVYDGIEGITDGEKQYIAVSDANRLPLAKIEGPKGTIDFQSLSGLAESVRLNTDDPGYFGTAYVPATGEETKLNKSTCGYALYFFETAIKEETLDPSEDPAAYDVRIEIGDTVYELQSDSGFFARTDADGTAYGTVSEYGLSLILVGNIYLGP